jgi:hypothetical protein
MCENAADAPQIHYALTRLIIVAIEVGDSASARRGIGYCLRLPVVSGDPDALLSFLSEIGDAFAIERPDLELNIRRRAHQLAEHLLAKDGTDARSAAHAKVSLLIAEALNNSESVSGVDLAQLREEYAKQGFLNPLIRLMNLAGFIAAVRKHSEGHQEALKIWTDCIELADATNHRLIRWHISQNLKKLHTLRGEGAAASSWSASAQLISGPFFGSQNKLRGVVADCLDQLSTMATLEPEPNEAVLPVSVGLLEGIERMSPILSHTECNGSWRLI